MSPSKAHSFKLRASQEQLAEWWRRHGATAVAKDEAHFREIVQRPEYPELDLMGLRGVSRLAGPIHYGLMVHGASEVLRGDSFGWQRMHSGAVLLLAGLNLQRCTFRLCIGYYAHTLLTRALLAYVVGDIKPFCHAVKLLESTPSSFNWNKNTFLFSLARFIRDASDKVPVNGSLCEELEGGPYAQIHRSWNKDTAELSQIMYEACNYHLERRSCNRVPEGDVFDDPIHLIPVEIFALQRLAEREGRAWPEVRHPLLDLKLPPPPSKPPEIEDPHFAKFIKDFMYYDADLRDVVIRNPNFVYSSGPTPVSTPPLPKAKPKLADLERLLGEGDIMAIQKYFEDGECIALDWREGLEEVIRYFGNAIASPTLIATEVKGGVELKLGVREASVRGKAKGVEAMVIIAIQNLLLPEREIRIYTDSLDGDTWVFILQDSKWWAKLDKKQPELMKKIFTKIDAKVFK